MTGTVKIGTPQARQGRRLLARLAGGIGAVSVLAGLVATPADAGQGCHKINTRVVGTADFVTNTVEGQVIGGGILHGTAAGSFMFTSVDPDTGTATYGGSYVITTKHGTLSLELFDGVIDLTTLTGTNDSVVTGGTGIFEGATGGLFFEGGVEAGGTFSDDLTGKICLAK